MSKKSNKSTQILKTYAGLRKKARRDLKMQDLVDAGFTKDMVKHHFSSLRKLDEAARAKYPKAFHDVAVESLYTQTERKSIYEQIAGYKRFFVTTAVTGCQVDDKFYETIQHYCKLNDAKLLVMLCSDPASSAGYSIDKKLSNEAIIFEDTSLNSNLFLSTIKTSAKQVDPITGLDRIGKREGSFIFASPKQRMEPVAVSNVKLPHVIMTTGAITKPNYHTDKYMSKRTEEFAKNDHVMGGLIVEIVDDNMYHYRQVQAASDGSFIDLGNKYLRTKDPSFVAPAALVLGDWHSGETDHDNVGKCTYEMLQLLKPQYLVMHDAFNGLSVNHHEEHHQIIKAQRAAKNQLSLLSELQGLARDLDNLSPYVKEIIVTKGNHDEFLSDHYLAKGKYTEDPQNHRISLDMAAAMIDGYDPLQFGVEKIGGLKSKNVRWLQRDEDFTIAGIQLGAHGDLGANGTRGSLASMERAYGASVSGHTHTPRILRQAWSVGTSTHLKVGYNEGASSWMQTHCIVYPNGSRQLINMFDGKWKL